MINRYFAPDLPAIRASVAVVGRLSDGLVRIGPFNLGLEALLSWVPGLGEVYSAGAAGFMIVQGVRAGVPARVLGVAAALMAGRTLIEVVPFAGALGADLFTAHRWSARLILAAIDRRLAAEAADPPRNVTPPARRTPWRPAARPDLEPV